MILLPLIVLSATAVRELPAGLGPLDNPLKGYAAYAAAGGSHSLPVTMAYVDASWRDLEPTEGKYAFDEWEQKEWNTPLAKDKHIVFRLYLDYPNQPVAVPQWLIDQGVKMNKYDQFGGGQSPDYEDPRLQTALVKLIGALGRRYNRDPRVAFVQIGTLGHWGEFHTYPRDDIFAKEATQKKVVGAFRAAFPGKHLMGRNPSYKSLQISSLGFHDDMIPDDTLGSEAWKFLPMLVAGGLANNWKVAPTGGEMVPGAAKTWMGEGWETTQKAVRDVHFSWLGPYCPALVQNPDATLKSRGEALIRMLGYEYRLKSLQAATKVKRNSTLAVVVQGVNQGVAPFYYPWRVELALLDSRGKPTVRTSAKADIRTWLPGEFRLSAPVSARVPAGKYRLALGIVDPWKGVPSIAFANALPRVDGYTILGSVEVTR